ncbi:helix-turn-helix domain-containing protein [Streptomyces similanensis]|uniref:XRE family transcriptional regulator n=1 Tax=Streptomyces similanensis TaxID=1274988 RepID=A0ABP9JVU5_9ACTN
MSDSDRVLPVSPSSPDPAAGLHAELLALKQRSGLSYSRISALTHYSKSSWERWINGKQFPPRGAVESFARAARTDAGPLLGLWERAERARGATAEGDGPAPEPTAPEAESIAAAPESTAADVPEPAPDAAEDQAAPAAPAAAPATDTENPRTPRTPRSARSARTPGRRRAPFLIAAAVAAAAALTAAGLTISHYVSDGREESPAAGGRAADAAAAARTDPVGCTQAGCTGKDPGAMGCARDGQTLALDRNGDMVVELRYSRTCGAAWGRITYAKPKAVVDVNNSSGTAEATPVHWGNDVYSPMAELSGEQTAWACGTQPGGKSRTCTVHSPVPAEH